jgi:hypothetical protein
VEEIILQMLPRLDIGFEYTLVLEYLTRFVDSAPSEPTLRILIALVDAIPREPEGYWTAQKLPELVKRLNQSAGNQAQEPLLRTLVGKVLERFGIDLRADLSI